jgi:hypothetical protein
MHTPTLNAYYNFECVTRGIAILATHPGPIKERLIAAFHDALCRVVPGLLPLPAAEIWADVWKAVTRLPADDQEGVFRLSIESLEDAEAVVVAMDVMAVEPLVRLEIAGYGGPEVVH